MNEKRSWLLRAPLPALASGLLLVAALLGLGSHALRNRLSDDEMFVEAIEIANRTNDPHLWKIGAYTGVRHVDEIDAIRLDRARGDIEALNDYLRLKGPRTSDAEVALFDLTKSDARALAAAVRRGGPGTAKAEDALYELQKGDLDALVGYIRKGGPRADQADDQLFAHAQKSGEARSYRFYIKHGKRHVDEAQSTLLPAAAYREVETSDDVGELGAFVREYPDSAHAGEIKAKIHGMYEGALRVYRERKPSAEALRFVTALLAELEDRADPAVNLDVNVNIGTSLGAANARLAESHAADYAPIETNFDTVTLASVEGRLRSDLVDRIRASFANGTVKPVGAGLGVDTGRPAIMVVCEPTIHDTVVSPSTKLRIADVRFLVEFHAVVPARSQELAWRFTTPGAKSADLTMNARREPSDPLDRDAVATMSYADMRIDGATQILERIQLDL